eukprot:jgi/Mesvir1/16812/Mv25084-RA.1
MCWSFSAVCVNGLQATFEMEVRKDGVLFFKLQWGASKQVIGTGSNRVKKAAKHAAAEAGLLALTKLCSQPGVSEGARELFRQIIVRNANRAQAQYLLELFESHIKTATSAPGSNSPTMGFTYCATTSAH